MREEDIMHQKTFKAYGLWLLICAVLWVVGWIMAESIPVFNDLLGVSGALFASWSTHGISGILYLHMNVEQKGWKIILLTLFAGTGVAVVVSLPALNARLCVRLH
jgi:hypothetical protein